jgi:hypothetical protein
MSPLDEVVHCTLGSVPYKIAQHFLGHRMVCFDDDTILVRICCGHSCNNQDGDKDSNEIVGDIISLEKTNGIWATASDSTRLSSCLIDLYKSQRPCFWY